MHELGHNLGLRHGGDEDRNCKPNYFSLMNYAYTGSFMSFNSTTTLSNTQIQFADGLMPAMDESQLPEINPFGLPATSLVPIDYYGDNPSQDFDLWSIGGYGSVDWDRDGNLDTGAGSINTRDKGPGCGDESGYHELEDFDDISFLNTHFDDQLPHAGTVVLSPDSYPYRPLIPPPDYTGVETSEALEMNAEVRAALEDLTGRNGAALKRFLERAGIDPKNHDDAAFLRRLLFATRRGRTVRQVAEQLFPDGFPGHLSNSEVEEPILEEIRGRVKAAFGVDIEVEFVDCPSLVATVADFHRLSAMVRQHEGKSYEQIGRHHSTIETAVPRVDDLKICR
jgi:hypothetical protein